MSIENNKEISLFDSLTPIIILIILLYINVSIYGDSSIDGSNQFILILGASIAFIFGIKNKIKSKDIFLTISENLKSISTPIIILLLVGALSGTWLVSGIIPSMIYYGLKLVNVSFFLPSCVVISSIVALATGSSWSTSATVGIGLIGIGKALGFDLGIVAGAIISGAYFGDKMSPLSDTTNLAAAVSGSNLFEHIKYMTITTVPTIIIALVFFTVYNLLNEPNQIVENMGYVESMKEYFFISSLSKTISSPSICRTMSISRVLAENLGTFLFLPEASSMVLSSLFSESKSSFESPARTRFRKSSPSKPSALVL